MTTQIIALGGGGFLTESEPGLDEYILAQSHAVRPNIGFIGTAGGDSERFLLRFYSRFGRLACEPSHLPLFGRTPDISDWVKRQDAIYVGGGNTRSMLATWAAWGLPALLHEAYSAGTVLAGVSAGAICWFESGVTDSIAGRLSALDCMGFLSGSCCPHYSLEPERKPAYEHMLLQNEIAAGCAIDDGVAIHFIDGKPGKVVSAVQDASAYAVSAFGGEIRCRPLAGVESVDVKK